MVRRKITNPLALAVLAVLSERSMYPYEIAQTLRSRGKERSIRLNYGSLYTVVDALVRADFIEPMATNRSGRRPERTIYALTSRGAHELNGWLMDILRIPVKEYPEFEAGLSLLPVLPPDAVIAALTERESVLAGRVAHQENLIEVLITNGLRRLYLLELEYECALLRAELAWVRVFLGQLKDGSLEDLEDWQGWHERAKAERDSAAGSCPRTGTPVIPPVEIERMTIGSSEHRGDA
jgi:DNA-binding PadR family transcriptional regulator